MDPAAQPPPAEDFSSLVGRMDNVAGVDFWGTDLEEDGPQATPDYLRSLVVQKYDPVSFDATWRKEQGLGEHSRVRWEHAFLSEVL